MEKPMKACPKCGEEVLKSAIKCKHCHSMFPFSSRHPITTLVLLLGTPVFFVWIVSISSTPPTPPTPEEIAAQQAEQEAFNQTPAGKLCLKHPGWSNDDCTRLINDRIWIGMRLDMLEYKRGKFTSHNVSNYGSGQRSQYCWDGRNPSCFYDDNGDGAMDAYN